MKNFKLMFLITVLAFLFFPAAAMAADNLITNGSFEQGGGEGSLIVVYPGGSAFPGWNVTLGGIERIEDTFWQASNGHWSLDMNGTNYAGGIQQGFSTTPGSQYLVNFDLAGNYAWGPAYTMDIYAASQSQSFSFDRTGYSSQDMGWTSKNFQFTADSAWTILGFNSTSNGSEHHMGGPALDNVFVSRVGTVTPEPISASLFLLGGGLLALKRSRRKK